MKTIYVKFQDPRQVFGNLTGVSEEEIKKYCFRAAKYSSYAEALDAYANTMATWSTILDEDCDVNAFFEEAYRHIMDNDYQWLKENFT